MIDPIAVESCSQEMLQIKTNILSELICALPELANRHPQTSNTYQLLRTVARSSVEALFSSHDDIAQSFGPFGELRFPYYRMGAIDSLDLFDLDELIIFSFYWSNRDRYQHVADLGANIGLHSIILARCGYEVKCYEPDPETFTVLKANLERNGANEVEAFQTAVSVKDGRDEFVRVIGNRTGSHLAGAKPNPYGDLDRFPVDLKAFGPIAKWADLMKIDVEGHEADLVLSTDRFMWEGTDAIMEVGSPENAKAVFNHLKRIEVNMFAQKRQWEMVEVLEDIPTSYRDGGLFVTTKSAMPWIQA